MQNTPSPEAPKNLVLVGFMGSGKSSVGRLVAKALGFQFTDTDQIVIDRAGRQISDIFETDGEAAFRALETEAIEWVPQLVGALAWSVLALSLGASSLLYMMIQRGAAAAVTSLMYLVPPSTAFMAWLLFDEAVTGMTIVGTVCTVLGVVLVVKYPAAAPVPRAEA